MVENIYIDIIINTTLESCHKLRKKKKKILSHNGSSTEDYVI